MKEEIVKGWIPWHRKHGVLVSAFRPHETAYQSEDAAWYRLQTTASYTKTREQLTKEGWRIRSVEIHFTDKGE